jgi:hypothetical protein
MTQMRAYSQGYLVATKKNKIDPEIEYGLEPSDYSVVIFLKKKLAKGVLKCKTCFSSKNSPLLQH